jgi:hypothetical protein
MSEEKEGVDALRWGTAEPEARDDATEENVEEGQVRDPDRPEGREREHQPEDRGERGA